ncbi:MAG: hypothetical protein COA52_09695 [Hyphomicrobiales bacterium]|nr:MAG: hypothetical protein COA52_09695 [Hyphomicrobiales bacterium]
MSDVVVVGEMKCLQPACTATVQVRQNKRGGLYYSCNGHVDRKACGDQHRFGQQSTEQMKHDFEKGNKADATEKTEPEKSERPAEPGNGSERKSGSSLFGYE